ncbi:hypothetical protein V6K52_03365 [Knoellia sp. S7-12]|uniref:hypothetical protein n=1 Tax=Knoellia sp. S7-12 TaxID=3126698 RepID=UPI003368D1AE
MCEVESANPVAPLHPIESKAIALYRTHVSEETEQAALEILLDICASEADFAEGEVVPWSNSVLAGAALVCPQAQHAKLMQSRAEGTTIDDGTYVVGDEMKPGTYRTAKGIRDCYWERTSGTGRTLDNDFVQFAPQGVSVRIRADDGGFVSRGCGTWTRAN